MLHGGEIAERIRIRQRSVFGKSLLQVGALHVMKAARVAAVVSGKNPPFGIDLDTEGIAAPFGEDFVALRFGMITPDKLAHRMHRLLVDPRALHVAGDGASLSGVEPAIGAPA